MNDCTCVCRLAARYIWWMCPVCLLEIWLLLLRCKVSCKKKTKTKKQEHFDSGVNIKSSCNKLPALFPFSIVSAGKVVHAETTVAHAVLNGSQYYHQDWAHSAAHVIVPPLRIDPSTPGYLMGLLGKYVLITATNILYLFLKCFHCTGGQWLVII